jgi:hypothetical protein
MVSGLGIGVGVGIASMVARNAFVPVRRRGVLRVICTAGGQGAAVAPTTNGTCGVDRWYH